MVMIYNSMKRTLAIATAGFVLVCLLARHALGADGEWVYWWPPTSNALGGYRVTSRLLNPPTNSPPPLPVVWDLKTNEITVATMDARLPVGTNEVTAISIGGETLVTNAVVNMIPNVVTGVPVLVAGPPIVITNFIANSPPSPPRYHKVVAPLVADYLSVRTGTSVTSLRTKGRVLIWSDQAITNPIIINLKQE